MNTEAFQDLLQPVFDVVGVNGVDQALAARLNSDFPADGSAFRDIEAACHAAIAAGWMCAEGGESLVLYMLPGGEIEFTGRAAPGAPAD